VAELKAWLATVKPDEYKQEAPWSADEDGGLDCSRSSDLRTGSSCLQYDNYKALAEKFATAHQSFLRNKQQNFKNVTLGRAFGESKTSYYQG
jgi:hypothetical protein